MASMLAAWCGVYYTRYRWMRLGPWKRCEHNLIHNVRKITWSLVNRLRMKRKNKKLRENNYKDAPKIATNTVRWLRIDRTAWAQQRAAFISLHASLSGNASTRVPDEHNQNINQGRVDNSKQHIKFKLNKHQNITLPQYDRWHKATHKIEIEQSQLRQEDRYLSSARTRASPAAIPITPHAFQPGGCSLASGATCRLYLVLD